MGRSRSVKRGGGIGGSLYQTGDETLMSYKWWYNWHYTPQFASPKGSEYVPMIWGRQSVKHLDEIPDSASALLGFNEPNIVTQSNMTPQEACALWPDVEAAAKRLGLILGSPGVNHCHFEPAGHCTQDPEEWLSDFFSACPSAHVDFLHTHYYGCDADAVVEYVGALSKKFSKPVWLTEFACSHHSSQDNLKYMQDVLAKLESLPATVLARYAWYAQRTAQTAGPGHGRNANTTLLAPGSHELTDLGKYYNEV